MGSKVVSMGAGIGLGSVQVAITEGFIDPKWHTFGNIVLGGLAVAVSQLTNLIKNEDTKDFLTAYGFTAAIGGVVQGVFPVVLKAVARNGRLGISPLTGNVAAVPLSEGGTTNGYRTGSYYPRFSGSFYRRPQSRARGFASDVTRNPMASIPTKIPYNMILS